jgi:hypothetical protein
MKEIFLPPNADSRSGRILWLVGLLVALIIIAYLAMFVVLTLRSETNTLAVIPWFDVSSIVGTLLISGGLPYGINRATYKPPQNESDTTGN